MLVSLLTTLLELRWKMFMFFQTIVAYGGCIYVSIQQPSKWSFHSLLAPSRLSHKASGSVYCSMASSTVASQASFSMQSLPTNELVVLVDWLHANLGEPM